GLAKSTSSRDSYRARPARASCVEWWSFRRALVDSAMTTTKTPPPTTSKKKQPVLRLVVDPPPGDPPHGALEENQSKGTSQSRMRDAEALLRVSKGDIGALAELFDRHAEALLKFVTRVVGSRGDAEDIVQSTFVRVVSAAPAFDRQHSASVKG